MVDRIDLEWGRELNKEFAEVEKNEKIEAGNALDATAREILTDVFKQETHRSPDIVESVIDRIETELLEADSTAKSALTIALREQIPDLSKKFIQRVADENEHIVEKGIKEREKRMAANRKEKKEPSGPF